MNAQIVALDAEVSESLLARWPPLLAGTEEEDRDWVWPELLRLHQTKNTEHLFASDGVDSVAMVALEQVQGILITSLPARIPRFSNAPAIVYVEYIAAAPWNRETVNGTGPRQQRIFKGVGPELLRYAVLRSLAHGRGGNIGLHSGGPRATNFYRERIMMVQRSPDPDVDLLDYFDGDAELARRLLGHAERK